MKQLIISGVMLLSVSLSALTPPASADDAMGVYRQLHETGYSEAVAESGRISSISGEPAPLDEYLAYALLHNPGLRASFTGWKAALEAVARVHSLPDPQMSYAYYVRNVETRVGPQRHRFELSQMFPWFGTLDRRSEVNLEEARAQWERLREEKLALIHDVKIAYYDVYFLEQRLRILRENMTLLSSLERAARAGYTAGTTEHSGLIRLQVELGRIEERLLSIRDRRDPLKARLNALLNREPDTEIVIAGSLSVGAISLTDEELADLVRERSPRLAALRHQRIKAERARDLAGKESMPSFGFGLSYLETGDTDMPGVKDSGKDPFMAMMTVTLPFWREKYDARKREAELQARAATERREQLYNGIIAELERELYAYEDAGRKIELYRDSLIPKANQGLNVTRTAFTSGTAGFLDMIDSQRTLLEFQLSHEEAVVNRAKAIAGIELLAGGEPDLSAQGENTNGTEITR